MVTLSDVQLLVKPYWMGKSSDDKRKVDNEIRGKITPRDGHTVVYQNVQWQEIKSVGDSLQPTLIAEMASS